MRGRWCGLPSLAKEPDAWVSRRVEAAVRDNLQRASGTNTADRYRRASSLVAQSPRHDAVPLAGLELGGGGSRVTGYRRSSCHYRESADPPRRALHTCASGSQDGYLATGGSRYLSSKRMQWRPHPARPGVYQTPRSVEGGAKEAHTSKNQDQDQDILTLGFIPVKHVTRTTMQVSPVFRQPSIRT